MDTALETSRGITNSEKTFSPEEVKKILNSDIQEIKRLCKQVCISPKKDHVTGQTFFLKNDVEILKKIKELHEKGQRIMQQENESTALVASSQGTAINDDSELSSLISTVVDARENIVERISKVIDEKLDGMDEVVVELIKTKAENERLKQKLNQITKDNYKLKNEVESYKPIKFGLYVKSKIVKFGSSNFTLS